MPRLRTQPDGAIVAPAKQRVVDGSSSIVEKFQLAKIQFSKDLRINDCN